MGVAEGCRVLARRHEAGEMSHIDHQDRVHLVGEGAEAGEVDVTGVGGAAGDDQLRPVLASNILDLVEVDQMVVGADAVLDGIEPFARPGRLGAVGEMAAGVRSEVRRGGKECVSTWRSRWSPYI